MDIQCYILGATVGVNTAEGNVSPRVQVPLHSKESTREDTRIGRYETGLGERGGERRKVRR